MKKLTDLPDQDLYPLIFRNLSIDDLFNCRLVNKQFKYFSDNTKGLNKLIIGQPDLEDDCLWYHNNKLIEDQEIISLECFRSIKLLSLFNLDKNLKYLKIFNYKLKLEEISNLINLEYLEFSFSYCHLNYYNQPILNLKSLKVFVPNMLSFKLNTPKLEKIKFDKIFKFCIQLDNPESIKHLIARHYQNEFEMFQNLEVIELRDNYAFINENLLIIFKYLNQLKINVDWELSYLDEEINDSLIKILNNKIKLRREIEIYLEGVKIQNIDKLNELRADSHPYWRFMLNNYELLDTNLSSFDLCGFEYEKLEECVNNIKNDLPTTFFDKFQNINHVSVNKVNDVDGFNWFLNNLKYLITLDINSDVLLGQFFYYNLPKTIRRLHIDNEEDINYDFILKLPKLNGFYTDIDKDLFDLAFKAFLNLKYLKVFKFFFKNEEIRIEKNGKNFDLNERIVELDYEQLIVECNKIRSDSE